MTVRQLLSSVSGTAIAAELRSYGLDVILDDPLRGETDRLTAIQSFIDRHQVDEGTPIVRTEPGALLRLFADPGAADVLINTIMATGWVVVPGETVTGDTAGIRLADRLRVGEAVTLTRETVPLLDHALSLSDPAKLTAWQRRVLRALAWFVTATGRPVLVAIRRPRWLRTTVGWRSARHLFASFPRGQVRWWPRG
ncbi:hypothetical protein [Methylobacterium sp.]|uniref:hypothetical protein n=1 Tax=Methylobacterium sp. TaxID=409 RepID=UPI003B00F90E